MIIIALLIVPLRAAGGESGLSILHEHFETLFYRQDKTLFLTKKASYQFGKNRIALTCAEGIPYSVFIDVSGIKRVPFGPNDTQIRNFLPSKGH